jgi:hypothetical protein
MRPRALQLILAIGFGVACVETTNLSSAETYPKEALINAAMRPFAA